MNTVRELPLTLARTLLIEDKIPSGHIARYESEVFVKSFVIPEKDCAPKQIVEAEEVVIPTFEITANPSWEIEESHRAESAVRKAYESLYRQENIEALKVIHFAMKDTSHHLQADDVSLLPIVDAMSIVEEHELEIFAFVCSPRIFRRLSLIEHKQLFIFRKKDLEENRQKAKDNKRMYGVSIKGTFFDIPIYVSELVNRDTMYVLAPPQFIGVIAVKRDVEEFVADIPQKKRYGKLISEEIGIGVINDYAVAGIKFNIDFTQKCEKSVETTIQIDPPYIRR